MKRTTIGIVALAFACVAMAQGKGDPKAQAPAPAGDVQRGQALYMKNLCYTCHGTAGQGGDRGSGPRIAYDVWPWEAFMQQVRHPREGMPRYPAQFVSDQDLADIYAYVASMKRGKKAAEIPLLKD